VPSYFVKVKTLRKHFNYMKKIFSNQYNISKNFLLFMPNIQLVIMSHTFYIMHN